jgi:hypothetical protein
VLDRHVLTHFTAATSNGIVQSQSAKPTDRLKFTQYAHMFLARLVTKADEEHGMKYDVSQVVLSDRIVCSLLSEIFNAHSDPVIPVGNIEQLAFTLSNLSSITQMCS